MKLFLNDPKGIVEDAVHGLLTNQSLAALATFPEMRVILRKEWQKDRVAVVSGGGSGHEPSHAGFVGRGMLTAAVCGDIFASPTVDAILSAILAVTGDAGVLLVIKNYTGDRLNFGLAADQARSMGYAVRTVLVNDDVALGTDVSRRGLAGTLFVHKIAGYLAEQGKSLDEIAEKAQWVVDNTYSIGLSLADIVGFQGKEGGRLSNEQAELGLGIHGESGAEIVNFGTADQLMAKAVEKLTYYHLSSEDDFALILNNLGAVTPIEMDLLNAAFFKTDLARQVRYVIGPGQLMTALNMRGFSISILRLSKDIEKALLADVDPVAWMRPREFGKPQFQPSPELPPMLPFDPSENIEISAVVSRLLNVLSRNEAELNNLDAKVGDGDAGSTLAGAARKIEKVFDQLPFGDLGELMQTIGRILSRGTGGSSGVLLSLLFSGAGRAYSNENNLGKALLAGLANMQEHGGAASGNRTMVDALEPAFEVLAESNNLLEASKAARKGADGTKQIVKTNYGRSSYLPENALNGIPDPGAEAVALVFEAIAL